MSIILTVARLLSGLWIAWVSVSWAAPARVYLLRSANQHCTATLLRGIGSDPLACRLVTNAHCLRPQETVHLIPSDSSRISASVREMFGTLTAPLRLSILAHDDSRDLAELSIPTELNQQCQQLDIIRRLADTDIPFRHELDPNRTRNLSGFASLGFHRQKAVVTFSQNVDWINGYGTAELYRVISGIPGLSSLYQLDHLRTLNGMSGGLFLTLSNEVLGLNVRLVPFQQESYFIPLDEVRSFLINPLSIIGNPSDASNSSTAAGDNAGGNGGDNAGGNGGDNAGGNGGDNAGGNGSDPLPAAIRNSQLLFLREPAEGIMVNGRRLLAFGTQQVDGRDDHRRLRESGLMPLYQDEARFQNLRSKLWDRIQGRYHSGHVFPMIDYILKENNEWVSAMYSTGGAILTVERRSRGQARIQLGIGDTLLMDADPTSISRLGTVPGQVLEFNASFDRSRRKITLRMPTGRVLECRNDFLLKLICSSTDANAPEEFSLSFSRVGNAVTKVRYSKLTPQGIYYFHGSLNQVSP